MKSYIIFGVGECGRRVRKELSENGINVSFFLDSDIKKKDDVVDGTKVVFWDDYIECEYDQTVIICSFKETVKNEMKRILEVAQKKYVIWEEFWGSYSEGKIHKLAIWGWWQGHNLGDNWIRSINKKCFPNAIFISTDYSKIEKFDFVLIGGGGVFINDTISPWNVENIPAFGAWGIGAEFQHKNKNAQNLAKQADFFWARDKHSYELMHIDNGEEAYDVTFVDPLDWSENVNIDSVLLIWYIKDTVSSKLYSTYTYRGDTPFEECKIYLKNCFSAIKESDFQTYDDDISSLIGDSGVIISGKYHGIVAAIQMGIPCVAIEVSTKLRDIMTECGLEEYCISVDETSKLPQVINKLKQNVSAIREKQWKYRMHAHLVMRERYMQIVRILDERNLLS